MAKSTISTTWFARFDGEKEFLVDKCKIIAGWIDTDQFLAAYHVGDAKSNPHCHFVLKTREGIQKQSMAVRLKKVFGLEQKNRDYSLDVWDGDTRKGATGYLFHESTSEILVAKNFSDDDIAAARLANEAVQRVVELNKEKASNKLVDKALEHFKDKIGVTKAEILAYMGREILEGNSHYPGSFVLKRYVEEVELRRYKKSDIDVWAALMEISLWR